MDDCLFCKIAKKELPADVIAENDEVIVFMSLENHPLVVTKRHFQDIHTLDDVAAAEVMKMTVRLANAVKKALNCEGVSLVQSNGAVAGQEIFHFHLHVRPRWRDDSMQLLWGTTTVAKSSREQAAILIKASLDTPSE